MKEHACPKCGRFLPRAFFTHTGGDCPRCKAHVVPEWYTWEVENRPIDLGMPMAPWSELMDINSIELHKLGLATVLNFHMGLELPSDTSKAYWPPLSDEPEYGPIDVTPSNAQRLAGMQGVDMLHNALLIVAGAVASTTGVERLNAVRAANLCYYMATRVCVGDDPLESEVRSLTEGVFVCQLPPILTTLQDAVFFVFDRLDLMHTPSIEFMMREHPSYLFD